MSKYKTVRTGLMGSAAILTLMAVAPAQAVETQFGDVSIVFDTTVSMGASMLTQDRDTRFLPEANGGPIDPRTSGPNSGFGAAGAPVNFAGIPMATAGALVATKTNSYSANLRPNFDGSINGDDGRLNFDKGDLIGANVKANHDLIVKWQNYTVFARAVGFYDVIMNDENAGSRSQLTDAALGDVGRNYELLDLFVSADYTIGDLPVNLRVGKQVINWGESTFIQNGMNAFNPIDVAAIRRPGAEIKEALVPVNAVFGSVALPFEMSLSGWYALDWEAVEIDPSGTPFSSADVIAFGTGIGGNLDNRSFVTASPFSANRRTCNALPGSGTAVVQGVGGLLPNPNGGALGNGRLECGDSIYVNALTPLPVGQHELIRLGQIDGRGIAGLAGVNNLANDGVTNGTTGVLLRGQNHEAQEGGQYGFKATWFAEDLNGTEFGFYYQNYHSRLPFVSINASASDTNGADISYFLNAASSNIDLSLSVQGRQLNNAGCGLTSPALIGGIAGAAGATINGFMGALGNPLTPGTAAFQMANTPVNDPTGILPAAAASLLKGAVSINPTNGFKNQLAVAQLNCVLTYYQSGFVAPINPLTGAPVAAATTVQSFDGAEFLLSSSDAEINVDYPEDIEQYGFSFNTTVGTWGLQGEATYRPSAPFQVDTDSLTIAALVNGCTFTQLYGAAGLSLGAAATPDGSGVKPACGLGDGSSSGVIRNEMFTAQIGTTATFTGSEWFIDAVGADLGVMVSEVGMVLTPDVEETWIDNLPAALKSARTQFANTGCQGTDLPLAGALSLDSKRSSDCRPTDLSAGLVMLFSLQYNNFLDTGFVLSPSLVYSYDFEGTTAAPYSNYLEDRQAINLGLSGSLNNNFRMGVNYSNFFGGHINNKSTDRDFASFNASYTF